MTHSKYPHIHTCSRCGSLYTVVTQEFAQPNVNSIDCEVCGVQLVAFDMRRKWSAELIRRGEWPRAGSPVANDA